MGEVFITRKGGGGKAAAPTIAVTDVGGSWAEVSITNNDAAPTGATLFVLANYDPNSATDFDLQASQNGFVFAVAEGATVTQLITGLDPDTSYTISASAAVIKKLPSSVVTTDPISLNGVGAQPAPSLGPIVLNSTNISNQNTTVISVTNNDTRIPLVIKANFTTNTTAPTTYPFETASVGVGATTNLTLTGLTGNTTFYIHARAFDGEFSSSNVVFGPYTTDTLPLYAFTNWTFTNAGITGRIGPTITEVRTAYSSQSWTQNNDYLNMPSFQGYQLWTVPSTGSYQIEAFGATRGAAGTQGASARVQGNINLTKAQKLWIICGQNGIGGSCGDGGSFVALSNNGQLTGSTPLFVAGGAGDYSYYTSETSYQTGQQFADAQTTDNLNASALNVPDIPNPVTGNGGIVFQTPNSTSGFGASGGGFNGDGVIVSGATGLVSFGLGFFNGLYGGHAESISTFDTTTVTGGGFGGAGNRGGGYGTGGGGGYTGGSYAGSDDPGLRRSTGGSSFVTPTATTVTRALATSSAPDAAEVQGRVIITKL